jgi:hypothetical protein
MSIVAASLASRRLVAYRPPVLDFLVPSLAQNRLPIRRTPVSRKAFSAASTAIPNHLPENGVATDASRTPKDDPKAAAKPAPLHKPLTKAQRDFLTSAVSNINQTYLKIKKHDSDRHQIPATSQPSRRIGRNPHLRIPNATHRNLTSQAPASNEAHA